MPRGLELPTQNTDLQINYNFNMVAIDDQRPVRVGLKHYLASYLAFQRRSLLAGPASTYGGPRAASTSSKV